MFMRYVHTEDDPVRAAAEAVTQRRQILIGGAQPSAPAPIPEPVIAPPTIAPEPAETLTGPADQKPLGLVDGKYSSRTKVGNYRPFRHRCGQNRAVPPGTRRADGEQEAFDVQ